MKPRRRKFPLAVYRGILKRQKLRCACGCRQKFDGVADINWDHILPIHLDGKDEPENLQALKLHHHKAKSNKEASARAKVKRIKAQDGLTKKKPSQKDKVMAKVMGLEL